MENLFTFLTNFHNYSHFFGILMQQKNTFSFWDNIFKFYSIPRIQQTQLYTVRIVTVSPLPRTERPLVQLNGKVENKISNFLAGLMVNVVCLSMINHACN